MDVIYGLMPIMIGFGFVFVLLLFWAVRSGQYDDMEGDASRILMDEDVTPAPTEQKQEEEDSTK